MKLTKDQIQKIALGGMMLCGIVYAYFEFLLAPLGVERETAAKNLALLEPQIKDAAAQIARTKGIEAKEPAAQLLLSQVNAMIPNGSPIAWLPTKVSDLFKKEGVEKVTVRMVNEFPEKELTGFTRMTWAVDVPRAGFVSFASAVSALENGEPLMEVQGFEIEAGRDDVQNQRISVNLSSLVRL